MSYYRVISPSDTKEHIFHSPTPSSAALKVYRHVIRPTLCAAERELNSTHTVKIEKRGTCDRYTYRIEIDHNPNVVEINGSLVTFEYTGKAILINKNGKKRNSSKKRMSKKKLC